MKVVKFSQPSCVPCRTLSDYLKVKGYEVDETLDIMVDEGALDKAVELGVKSTPTLVLFDDDGNEVDRVSGMNQEGIEKIFNLRNS